MRNIKPNSPGPTSLEPAPPSGNPPWSFEPASPVTRRATSLLWNPHFLRHTLESRAPYTFRSGGAESDEAIVVADIFMMDDETFSVEAQLLCSSSRSEHYTLRVRLAGETRSDARPRVTLRWGKKTYTEYMRAGTAVFTELPPISDLQARINNPSHDFGLTIDFGDTAPRRAKKS